jgi:cellulose synthase operon protein C
MIRGSLWQAVHTRLALALLLALQVACCSSPEERAESYYKDGVKLLSRHDYQRAAIEFKNAIRLKADLLSAWRGLAQAEALDHHWPEVVQALRAIVQRAPTDTSARVKLARLLLVGGAVEDALKVVNDAAEPGNNADLLALKAAILQGLKDNDGAAREAEAALKLQPDNVDALVVLAAQHLANNDPKGALQLLPSGVETQDPGVRLLKIKILERLGNLAEAESLLRSLTNSFPKEPAFRKQLIGFYLEHDHQADAEKELRSAVAADPSNSEVELELARLLSATKGPAAARMELVGRISLGGDVFPYQMALAELDGRNGNFADSVKLLEALAADKRSQEHVVAAKLELAELYLGRDLGAADNLVSEVIRDESPGNLRHRADALKIRGAIYLERAKPEAAVGDLREALEIEPRSTEIMSLLATAYERSGSMFFADKEFSDALKASDYAAAVGLNYAAFLRRRGNIERADYILTVLADRQPRNLAIMAALADVKLRRQDWAGAQEAADAMRRIGGSNATADQILGAALSGEHRDDASIAAYQEAVAADPTGFQPMESLVSALMRNGQTDRAVSFLQNILKADPENAAAYVLIGSIEVARKAPDRAKTLFQTAIAKRPKDIYGYRALADLYLSQGNADAALKTIRLGLSEQPDNIVLHMLLAGILERIDEYQAAISEYEFVLSKEPGSIIAANNLASLLADHRTDKDSLERAQALAASLLQSPVPQFMDTLGWISYRRGDFIGAASLLERAAVALPDIPLIHYHLGMDYLATGQRDKALKEFTIALAKGPDKNLEKAIKAELRTDSGAKSDGRIN